MIFYRFGVFVCLWALRLCYFTKYKKSKYKPQGHGAIVCANHISAADPVLLTAGIRSRLTFYAKAELWKAKMFRWFLNLYCIPVNRGAADMASMRSVLKALKDNKTLCIFPQGTRHPGEDPESTQVKSGIALIAHYSKCDIIPAYIHTKNNKLRLFRQVQIIYGDPIHYEDLHINGTSSEELAEVSNFIWKKICELKPEDKNANKSR